MTPMEAVEKAVSEGEFTVTLDTHNNMMHYRLLVYDALKERREGWDKWMRKEWDEGRGEFNKDNPFNNIGIRVIGGIKISKCYS